MEDIILSCLMNAKESSYVATIDIPGAFMHADIKDEVNMKLEVTMADLFANIDPQIYEEYVTTKNGKNILYFRLNKYLYLTDQAYISLYQKLTRKLNECVFEMNP